MNQNESYNVSTRNVQSVKIFSRYLKLIPVPHKE